MFQQLISPIKLEAVTNFSTCLPEQNILRTLSFFSCTLLRLANLFFSEAFTQSCVRRKLF